MKKQKKVAKYLDKVTLLFLFFFFILSAANIIKYKDRLVSTISSKFSLLKQQVPVRKNSNSQTSKIPLGQNDEIKSILNPPVNGTEDEKKKHAQLIEKYAQQSDFLDIADCKAKPLVVKIAKDSTLNIRNSDSQEHILPFTATLNFKIPANSSRAVPASSLAYNGPGIYGFGCDSGRTSAGMILVTP